MKTENRKNENANEPITENTPISPKEYFDILKGNIEEASSEDLKALYAAATSLMDKYRIAGQKSGAEKLFKFTQVCAKEIKAVEFGITRYVRRKTIDEYITNVASSSVVLIELENYERDIPDDVVSKISRLKDEKIFDDFYIIFTDYTGSERKKVEQSKRDKDPILFGAMRIGNQINTRLYYIADWVDEYCDLTLDKLVREYSKKLETDPTEIIIDKYPTLDAFRDAFKESKNDIDTDL